MKRVDTSLAILARLLVLIRRKNNICYLQHLFILKKVQWLENQKAHVLPDYRGRKSSFAYTLLSHAACVAGHDSDIGFKVSGFLWNGNASVSE